MSLRNKIPSEKNSAWQKNKTLKMMRTFDILKVKNRITNDIVFVQNQKKKKNINKCWTIEAIKIITGC